MELKWRRMIAGLCGELRLGIGLFLAIGVKRYRQTLE
jgi:hypothetical protein